MDKNQPTGNNLTIYASDKTVTWQTGTKDNLIKYLHRARL